MGRMGLSALAGGVFGKGGATPEFTSIGATAARGFLGRSERTTELFLTGELPVRRVVFDDFRAGLPATERRGVFPAEDLRVVAERRGDLGAEDSGLLGVSICFGYFLTVY